MSWAGLLVRRVHMPSMCSVGPWQHGAWVPERAAMGKPSKRPRASHNVTPDVQVIISPPCAVQPTKSYPPYIQGKENQTLHLMWKATWAQKEEKDQWWPALENTSWNIFPCAVRSEGIFLDSFIVLTFLNFIFSCGHKGESFGVGNNR